MDPVTGTIIASTIAAAGSTAGGYLASKGAGKETAIQKRKKKLIDQLLASLEGSGPYSDLYNFDEKTFNKSFVEPAQAMFRNQIAPQIQQQYIASGQQRGTGLDDTLTRAGVDLDALINQHMFQAQENATNRKQNAINSILGSDNGAAPENSSSQNWMQAGAGYLSSDSFSDAIADITKKSAAPPAPGGTPTTSPSTRAGYKSDWNGNGIPDWKLGDKRWNQY